MSQDPLKPKDSGKVGLPKIDAAMNKLPPTPKDGGKGGKDDPKIITLGAERGKKQDDEMLLARARKRFDRVTAAESDNRKAAIEDLKFKAGDQWPADVAAQRNFDKRPCLTINKIPTFVHQITNDLRQNRPTINVSPVGERGDKDVAKMYRGLIRAIERESAADIAYDTAVDNAVSNGFGYWRITTEYDSPDSFDQVIRIKRIRNPFTVYLDPDRQEPDGSDAKWGFISEMIPRDEFEETYPKANPVPWMQAGIGDTLKNWATQDGIRIAEYFEISHKMKDVVLLSNGHEGWEDELGEEAKKQIESGALEVLKRRKSETPDVMWYKLTAMEILERKKWEGKWIPIVQVIGNEIDIEGKLKLSGIIRGAKDAQRMVNYWTTSYTELVALAPKAPWVVEEGQIEGHEAQWKQANVKNYPYLSYKGTSVGGKPAPPPQRQAFAGVPQGVQQAIAQSESNMQATTGIRFDATMNERMFDESGKAIRELRRTGDLGSFHYADNLARSLRHAGAQYIDLIPKIYDTKRIVTILREDDTEESVQIDPHAREPMQDSRNPDSNKGMKIFNPTYGKYGVTVTIGPSFATKRIEASENMMAFAKAMPNTAMLIADLIAEAQDWPGAEKMAARLAKAVPPQLLMPEQKDMTPQVQALLVGLQQQIQLLSQERAQMIKQLNDQNADRMIDLKGIESTMQAKMAGIEEKFLEALMKIGAKKEEIASGLEADITKDFIGIVSQAAQDRRKSADDMIQRQLDFELKLDEQRRKDASDQQTRQHEVQKSILEFLQANRRPKKIRLVRGADGVATEAIAEYGDDGQETKH